ncbi:hypothetical protein C8F04DRAFT_1100782, partial [Mycena alexandri]
MPTSSLLLSSLAKAAHRHPRLKPPSRPRPGLLLSASLRHSTSTCVHPLILTRACRSSLFTASQSLRWSSAYPHRDTRRELDDDWQRVVCQAARRRRNCCIAPCPASASNIEMECIYLVPPVPQRRQVCYKLQSVSQVTPPAPGAYIDQCRLPHFLTTLDMLGERQHTRSLRLPTPARAPFRCVHLICVARIQFHHTVPSASFYTLPCPPSTFPLL